MRSTFALLTLATLTALPAAGQAQQFTSVERYLPEGCPGDGSVDLTEPLQRAFAECDALYFPGSDDPAVPRIYAACAGLVTRENARIVFGPNTLLRRLPSEGSMIRLERGASLAGCVLDGNKYEHWPEFPELGKSDYGIQTTVGNVVTDCFVYNNPGIAFGGYCHECIFERCRAENVGYIDVKFGADFYQGAWDQWSGDGFYVRGRRNVVRDCVAYDCFRWDLCASHSGARGNTFVDCRGGDVNFRTYGFVDIEDAEPDNRLIRCISPNSHISISSPHTQLIDCVMSGLWAHHADYLTVRGCTMTSGGLALGRPEAEGKQYGGASPIITGNRIFMNRATGRAAPAPLHVRSEDGAGIVAGNIVYAVKAKGEGPTPLSFEGFEAGENQVVYGRWDAAAAYVRPRLERGNVDWEHIAQHKLATFAAELTAALPGLGVEGEPAWQHVIIGEVPFAFDAEDAGVDAQWFLPVNRPKTRPVRVGWPWNRQVGEIYQPGWYFIDFQVPAEQAGNPAWLYFGGVDSEAIVWLNGERLGEHEGWNEPFSFEVTGKLVAGTNRLVVRSYTESGLAGIYKPIAVVVK